MPNRWITSLECKVDSCDSCSIHEECNHSCHMCWSCGEDKELNTDRLCEDCTYDQMNRERAEAAQ